MKQTRRSLANVGQIAHSRVAGRKIITEKYIQLHTTGQQIVKAKFKVRQGQYSVVYRNRETAIWRRRVIIR